MKLKNNLTIETQLDAYRQQGFSTIQLNEIAYGLRANLDPSMYANIKFSPSQISRIVNGLFEGLDVSIYAKECYDVFQMYEIYNGLKSRVDVSLYASPEFDSNETNSSWFRKRNRRLRLFRQHSLRGRYGIYEKMRRTQKEK